jgi:hypothetical protein
MPSYDDPYFELDELGRLFWRALKELPIRSQLQLFSEIAEEFDATFEIDGTRPFVYVAPGTRLSVAPERLNTCFHDWAEQLAFGLLRHHGLDPDRIAILHHFGALGPPPPITPAEIRVAFGPYDTETGAFDLSEIALVTELLLQFDVAFKAAFEPFGVRRPAHPKVSLTAGSIRAILSSSISGAGILLLLDALSAGGSLPFTVPLYAQLAVGGTLSAGGIINTLIEQRNKWTTGTETIERAKKLSAETTAIAERGGAEVEKLRAEAEKTRAEADKAKAEAAKALADALKARSDAQKVLAEMSMMAAQTDAAVEKTHAEAAQLRATADKLRVETEAAMMALLFGSEEQVSSQPPASAVPVGCLVEAAAHHNVKPAVAALAVNAGFPILARAQAVGMQITQLKKSEG